MKVGFIGLGAIGRPIATRLAGHHEVALWNRTPGPAAEVAAATGARSVTSARAAAEGAQVVFTCLPNSPELEEVLAGPDGLAAGMERGSLLVDLTSGIPDRSRAIAEGLLDRGVGFLDAPVSGGTAGAEAGTLTIMVGGRGEDFDRAEPLLQAFGRRIVHVGPVGAGHALKAVHNALIAVHLAALGEGLTALARAGVAPATALAVINAANGRSFVSERLFPERVLTGAWPRTFRLALLEKDVGIARALTEDLALEAPVIHLVSDLLRQGREALGDEVDHVEWIKLYEQRAGVELRG